MLLTLRDRIGNCNPQLLRELGSRLNLSNFGIALAISLIAQLLVSLYCWSPTSSTSAPINWQSWWKNLFLNLGLVGIWLLIVAGTYLLVKDLASEKKNGTLDFIRFSPRSTQSILIGKMLGVPIVLYGIIIFALPLHLWAGLASQIPLSRIFSFYGVLVVSCFFFYSVALLYALVGDWLSGIQPWLFSGMVWAFLWLNLFDTTHAQYLLSPANTLVSIAFDSPEYDLSYLEDAKFLLILIGFPLQFVHWFYVPVGERLITLIGLILFNYAFWTYWIWQALERCFPNPNATLLTKRQSYVLAVCFGVLRFGSALDHHRYDSDFDFGDHLDGVISPSLGQLCLFLFLIVALSPSRQALLDWTRYHQQRRTRGKNFWNRALLKDLLWDEKSPALLTLAINLLITVPCIVPWIWSWPDSYFKHIKPEAFLALPLEACMILIFAAIAQLMILVPTRRPALSNLCIPGVIIFWIVVANFAGYDFGLSLSWGFRSSRYSEFSLIFIIFCTTLVVAALIAQLAIRTSLGISIPGITIIGITIAFSLGKFGIEFFLLPLFLCELYILGLLSWQLTRQLQRAGKLPTKAPLTRVS
ncbi:MAG: hypothetical protein RID09_19020 [Coleofasciculus sp. G1-WW12-02]|uniref:hypothetical protein n=1 Tax=Coleofasciculus sp. G1-WW12-02 TaxID=3068483 RepID=UPI0032F2D385